MTMKNEGNKKDEKQNNRQNKPKRVPVKNQKKRSQTNTDAAIHGTSENKPVTDFLPEDIEALIKQGAEQMMQDGVPKKTAWTLARQVFEDIHIFQKMVLKYPHFIDVIDLLEITDGMPLIDTVHRFRMHASKEYSYTIRTVHDLIHRMYMLGFYHGHLSARTDDNLDAEAGAAFLEASGKRAEYIVNTMARAYSVLLPEMADCSTTSVSIETIPQNLRTPKYKNTSVRDF